MYIYIYDIAWDHSTPEAIPRFNLPFHGHLTSAVFLEVPHWASSMMVGSCTVKPIINHPQYSP